MKKKINKIIDEVVEEIFEEEVKSILPITQEFSNGDMNVLRDKINEIIATK